MLLFLFHKNGAGSSNSVAGSSRFGKATRYSSAIGIWWTVRDYPDIRCRALGFLWNVRGLGETSGPKEVAVLIWMVVCFWLNVLNLLVMPSASHLQCPLIKSTDFGRSSRTIPWAGWESLVWVQITPAESNNLMFGRPNGSIQRDDREKGWCASRIRTRTNGGSPG